MLRVVFGKMDFKEIGEKFVLAYYHLFDTDRSQLVNFYVSLSLCYIFVAYRTCMFAFTEFLITVTSNLSFRVSLFSGRVMLKLCLHSTFYAVKVDL